MLTGFIAIKNYLHSLNYSLQLNPQLVVVRVVPKFTFRLAVNLYCIKFSYSHFSFFSYKLIILYVFIIVSFL